MMLRSLVLRTTLQLMLTLLLVFSVFLLFRGHDHPGGGFTGGLVATAALALHALTFGSRALRRLLPLHPARTAAIGMAALNLAAMLPLFFGGAFLEGQWIELRLGRALGTLELGTPILFDVGIYLIVVGAVSTAVLALAEED